MKPLIKIERLQCEYKEGIAALNVMGLEIYPSELTFVVGASGSGKSTLLEALGLMTKTAKDSPNFTFTLHTNREEEPLQLHRFWQWDAGYRSKIRSSHFSFIFQQENMFSSLNAVENMLLPSIGLTPTEENSVNQEIMRMSDELLPEVELTKPIMAYSGGQRQRFAFIRALAKPHSVLLADEPTGNLDPLKAQEAINMTKALVGKKETAAVVVSHDIALAINNADRIILINKPINNNDSPPIGNISEEHIFSRTSKGWESATMKLSDKALNTLIEQSLQSLNSK